MNQLFVSAQKIVSLKIPYSSMVESMKTKVAGCRNKFAGFLKMVFDVVKRFGSH